MLLIACMEFGGLAAANVSSELKKQPRSRWIVGFALETMKPAE